MQPTPSNKAQPTVMAGSGRLGLRQTVTQAKQLAAKVSAAVRQSERHRVAFFLNPHTMHSTKIVLNGRNDDVYQSLLVQYELVGVYQSKPEATKEERHDLHRLIADDLRAAGAIS